MNYHCGSLDGNIKLVLNHKTKALHHVHALRVLVLFLTFHDSPTTSSRAYLYVPFISNSFTLKMLRSGEVMATNKCYEERERDR